MTDQDLIGYLNKLDQKIDGLREENQQTRAMLEQEIQQSRVVLEEEIRQTREENRQENRQTRVMLEGLRSQVQLVAEGVIGQGEGFARRQSETLRAVEEMKALVTPLYQDFDRRVKILEDRAERQTRDVVEVILDQFGKR